MQLHCIWRYSVAVSVTAPTSMSRACYKHVHLSFCAAYQGESVFMQLHCMWRYLVAESVILHLEACHVTRYIFKVWRRAHSLLLLLNMVLQDTYGLLEQPELPTPPPSHDGGRVWTLESFVNLSFQAAHQYDSHEAVSGVHRGPHTFLWQYSVSSLFGSVNQVNLQNKITFFYQNVYLSMITEMYVSM